MNTKHLFFICIVSTSIFAMKNEETSLTLCNTEYTYDDLFYTPYLSTIHKKNPISESEKSLFCELTNKNCSDIANYLNDKHSELTKLAHKYKIQNLYIALLAQTISALKIPNELHNIITKNYNSLITYTSNPSKALNHFKQSLLNYKIPKTLLTTPYNQIYIDEYSYDKKYGLCNKMLDLYSKVDKSHLYEIETNKEMNCYISMLYARFLFKQNNLVYINSNNQLIHYDIATEKQTTILKYLPYIKKDEIPKYSIHAHPNNTLFITQKEDNMNMGWNKLLLVLPNNETFETVISEPFLTIAFNKDYSLIITSTIVEDQNSIITLYSFDKNQFTKLACTNIKTCDTLRFIHNHSYFMATRHANVTTTYIFKIIKEDNTHHLKQMIQHGGHNSHILKKHNKFLFLDNKEIDKEDNNHCSTDKPLEMTILHYDDTSESLAHCYFCIKSALSKNSQYFAFIQPNSNKNQITFAIKNLFTGTFFEDTVEINAPNVSSFIIHPNNTLLIVTSSSQILIYDLENKNVCSTVPICNEFIGDNLNVIGENKQYRLYSPEDLKNLDEVDSINLLQYFALKRINDRSKGSDGTYTVPQTMFNTLCWNSFSNDNRELLSKTLNVDTSALNNL